MQSSNQLSPEESAAAPAVTDENVEPTFGRLFEGISLAIIALSLVAFTIETLPNLSASQRRLLALFEIIFSVVFALEYLFRIVRSKRKRAYVFSFYGIVDLLSWLPSLLMLSTDLYFLRALRIFRVLRIFKLSRHIKATEQMVSAFYEVRASLAVYVSLTALTVYLAAVGIYFFEQHIQPETFGSIPHCLWWAVTTLTTVGYGDSYPVTLGGRLFTTLILILGIGLVAIPGSLYVNALVRANSSAEDDKKPTKS